MADRSFEVKTRTRPRIVILGAGFAGAKCAQKLERLIGRSEADILLVGTHLGLAPSERAAQIDFLLGPEWLGGVSHRQPAIFLGDFNLAPGGTLYRRLVANWHGRDGRVLFHDVQAHAFSHVACRTFPSFLPVRRLDHIFVTPHFEALRVDAPANQLTRRASDHLPLVADLMLHA